MFKHKTLGFSDYHELEIEYDSNIKFDVDMGKTGKPSSELLELVDVALECLERTTDSCYTSSNQFCEILYGLLGDRFEELLEYKKELEEK